MTSFDGTPSEMPVNPDLPLIIYIKEISFVRFLYI